MRQTASSAAALALLPSVARSADESLLDLNSLQKFVDPLPIPRRAEPHAIMPGANGSKHRVAHYRVTMKQFEAQVHRDMKPTTFWGYDGACPGPTFDVRCGEPVNVEWINALPNRHLYPIDHTLHGAEADKPEVRTVVHLHGGRVSPENDGYPEHWFTPGHSATCFYPNQQDATALFYHDHAMGITRLNTLAGLMGLYFIRDEWEEQLHLPSGPYEIPLVLFDRSFLRSGQIFYPTSGDPNSPWVSEYHGGGILANGKLYPYLDVQPRKYRFRLLNSSNGSFYVLSLASGLNYDAEVHPLVQIGSDQGFLAESLQMNQVIIGPGERIDLIIDFSSKRGQQLYVKTKIAPIMQFRVSNENVPDSPPVPTKLRPVPRMSETTATKTRNLTLADHQDRLGRSHAMLLNGMHWMMPVTENPVLGSTEIWSLINLTDDSHPIHLHLVRFQILDRRPFDQGTYSLKHEIAFTGPAIPLDANELGWKDTVRSDPYTVTRIIVKFEGFVGRYVWHCHMLEHEDNEMMRPYDVIQG